MPVTGVPVPGRDEHPRDPVVGQVGDAIEHIDRGLLGWVRVFVSGLCHAGLKLVGYSLCLGALFGCELATLPKHPLSPVDLCSRLERLDGLKSQTLVDLAGALNVASAILGNVSNPSGLHKIPDLGAVNLLADFRSLGGNPE